MKLAQQNGASDDLRYYCNAAFAIAIVPMIFGFP